MEGLKLHGKDWRLIEEHIGSRTCSQIRSHAQKYFLRYERLKDEKMQRVSSLDSDEVKLARLKTLNMKPRRRSTMFSELPEENSPELLADSSD